MALRLRVPGMGTGWVQGCQGLWALLRARLCSDGVCGLIRPVLFPVTGVVEWLVNRESFHVVGTKESTNKGEGVCIGISASHLHVLKGESAWGESPYHAFDA